MNEPIDGVSQRIFNTVKNLILTETSYIIVLDNEEQIEAQHDDIVAVTTGGRSYTKLVCDLVIDDVFICMMGAQKDLRSDAKLF